MTGVIITAVNNKQRHTIEFPPIRPDQEQGSSVNHNREYFEIIDETGFITYTGTSHQEAINMLCLHFLGALMSSIFIYSL